jgi:hypothetical protein
VLVPAFMHVLGSWNWWAPRPLVRLHERIGFSESGPDLDEGMTAKSDRAVAAVTETR